jgi:hypothetical protein
MKMVIVVFGDRVSIHTVTYPPPIFFLTPCVELINFNAKYWQPLKTHAVSSGRVFQLPRKEFTLEALNKPGARGYTHIIAHTSEQISPGWRLPIDDPHHFLQLPLGKPSPSIDNS